VHISAFVLRMEPFTIAAPALAGPGVDLRFDFQTICLHMAHVLSRRRETKSAIPERVARWHCGNWNQPKNGRIEQGFHGSHHCPRAAAAVTQQVAPDTGPPWF